MPTHDPTVIAPSVLAAASDRRLRGEDLRILIILHTELDIIASRPLKRMWLASRCQMREVNVSRGLRRLVVLGYLERGAASPGIHTYRLTLSPPRVSPVIPLRTG